MLLLAERLSTQEVVIILQLSRLKYKDFYCPLYYLTITKFNTSSALFFSPRLDQETKDKRYISGVSGVGDQRENIASVERGHGKRERGKKKSRKHADSKKEQNLTMTEWFFL